MTLARHTWDGLIYKGEVIGKGRLFKTEDGRIWPIDDILGVKLIYEGSGGLAKTEAKRRASRENGRFGGRPRKKPKP